MSRRTRNSIFLIIVVIMAGIWLMGNYKPAVVRIATSITSGNSNAVSGRADRALISIYTDIHHMSHHVVIADEKWGFRDLTLENIEKAMGEIEGIEGHDETKKELLSILRRWESGDFSRAHHDHNYVWRKLGGTVGKATGVNTKNLPEWANR